MSRTAAVVSMATAVWFLIGCALPSKPVIIVANSSGQAVVAKTSAGAFTIAAGDTRSIGSTDNIVEVVNATCDVLGTASGYSTGGFLVVTVDGQGVVSTQVDELASVPRQADRSPACQ